MADWRQIQARIRKAKASPDAPAKLAELYERTRDAMVAFELAQWQEKAGAHAEAARWYTTAAERFRRAQWRTKAEAALARLGSSKSVSTATEIAESTPPELSSVGEEISSSVDLRPQREVSTPGEKEHEITEPILAAKETAPSQPSTNMQAERKHRRRGRRGGRNRRPIRPAVGSGTVSPSSSRGPAIKAETVSDLVPRGQEAPPVPREPAPEWQSPPEPTHSYAVADVPALHTRSRAGDPGLSSRIAQLESQVRRLLACPQMSLEKGDQAPAGPGVLLLSDSDQVTHYYIEACQTLRIAIGILLRGGRGDKDSGRLKERLAENLGIGESRVGRYLKDHCAVRWVQLDEGASELAHFAIAVLRPVVNE
jgi:hypothetical protein